MNKNNVCVLEGIRKLGLFIILIFGVCLWFIFIPAGKLVAFLMADKITLKELYDSYYDHFIVEISKDLFRG